MKKTMVHRCHRLALSGLLMAVFLFSAGASAQVSQCIRGKVNYEECWVALEVSGNSIAVSPSDVAVYSDTKLSWKRTGTVNPPDKPDFAIDFDSNGCTPFRGVFHFDQSSAAPISDEVTPAHFELCKYKVTIGSLTADPQVLVIGGPKHQSTSWSRRHLGQW
ncbi:MAG: hypothetical protein WAL32_04570 [Terriglobales bacterium]